ncbi:MAG: FISUMP domain-containing protein [Candidatus Kryptoniota bacterium]
MKNTFHLVFWISMMILAAACEEEDKRAIPLELEAVVTNVSTFNGNDGKIELQLSGGEKPYWFFWSTGDTTKNINNLYAGIYSVKVIYGKNGSYVVNRSFTLTQPEAEPLHLSFIVKDLTNYGNPQGKIKVEVTGGTPPYKFLWSNGDTASEISGLKAGIYEVTATDNSAPFKVITKGSVEVKQPAFSCGRDSIRDIDNFVYPTVLLGNQCWLAENLRTFHDPSFSDMSKIIDGRYCYNLYCEGTEGAHYSWQAAMASHAPAPEDDPSAEIQGICPDGWHIPTKGEWDELEAWLKVPDNGGSGTLVPEKLKGANSPSGFDALLVGNFGYAVYDKSKTASFWVSTEYSLYDSEGRMVYIADDQPILLKSHRPKTYGLSVRCLKNRK